jgi:ABC-type multidrug transport system ATPase subunit
MSLALKDVRVQFDQTKALDGVSLRFPRSGLVALIGENGAGKSTLLDVLSGFIEQGSGVIEDVSSGERRSGPWLRDHCARLHQSIVLPGELTPAEFFEVARNPDRGKWLLGGRVTVEDSLSMSPRFNQLLEQASIALDRPISEHSWGQQRVVGLVAVLMVDRNVLLLDEPFAGLASEVTASASALVLESARTRLVIFSEHDIQHALEIANIVLVFKAGQLKANLAGDEMREAEILQYFG